LKSFGKIDEFGQAITDIHFKKKIDYHCPNILKEPIYSEGVLQPLITLAANFKDRLYSTYNNPYTSEDIQGERKDWRGETWAEQSKHWMGWAWTGMITKAK